ARTLRGRGSMMGDVRTEVVPAEAFGEAAAGAFMELCARHGTEPLVGLATGNTPTTMYLTLAARGVGGTRAVAVDEYVGPREHACSNRAYFRSYWEPLAGASGVEQFDPGAADLGQECERVAAAIAAGGGLDLAVLGIGLNGHLAFNEPGSDRDCPARVVELHQESRTAAAGCWGSDTPTHGMTLGLRELLGAKSVLLLANRGAKAAIVARALQGKVGPECPASWLQGHSDLRVVLDEAAARYLR
ncbi:MAG: 6-phosphogluconolactonase, partial [Dehalococcoidia bacterium]